MFTTGDRWYQVNSCPVGERIVEAGFLAIDADDHPALGRKVKTCQNIGHTTARGQLTPNHPARRARDITHQSAVQMHFDFHGQGKVTT